MSGPRRIADLSAEERAAIVAASFHPPEVALANWEAVRAQEAAEVELVTEAYERAVREREERRRALR